MDPQFTLADGSEQPTDAASALLVRARYRRAGLGFGTSMVARGTALAVSLLAVPLILPYAGTEGFGIWVTIASFGLILSFSDLGVGLGLMNAVVHGLASDDHDLVRRAISNSVAIAIAAALVVAGVSVLLVPLVPWATLFHLTNEVAVSDVTAAAMLYVLLYAVGIPLALAANVRNGLQQMYVSNLLSVVGSISTLVIIVVAIQLDLGLAALTAALALGPVIANGLNAITLLLTHHELRPASRMVAATEARALLGEGMNFLAIQAALAVALFSDTLVLSAILGPSSVAEYSIVSRLFFIPLSVASAIALALWPAYRDAFARHDAGWARTAFRRSVMTTLVVVVVSSVALLVAGPAFVGWLSRGEIQPSLALFVAFAVSTLAVSIASALSIVLNSAGRVRPQVIPWLSLAIANLSIGVLLTRTIGVTGVVWATAITFALISVPLARMVRSTFARASAAAPSSSPQVDGSVAVQGVDDR